MLLEFRTTLRTATKVDLFDGDVHDLAGKQWVKENVTVFYTDYKTNQLTGPKIISAENNFTDLYHRMAFGKCGVIASAKELTKDFSFDMVLREASVDDLKYNSKHIKLNRIYYIYAQKVITGPFYTDRSLTLLKIDQWIDKKEIFVPNERQHFRIKG